MDVTTQLLSGTNKRREYNRTLRFYHARHSIGYASPEEGKAFFHFQAVIAQHYSNEAMSIQDGNPVAAVTMEACEDFDGNVLGDFYQELAKKELKEGNSLLAREYILKAVDFRIGKLVENGATVEETRLHPQYWVDQVILGCISEANEEDALRVALQTIRLALTKLQAMQANNPAMITPYVEYAEAQFERVYTKSLHL